MHSIKTPHWTGCWYFHTAEQNPALIRSRYFINNVLDFYYSLIYNGADMCATVNQLWCRSTGSFKYSPPQHLREALKRGFTDMKKFSGSFAPLFPFIFFPSQVPTPPACLPSPVSQIITSFCVLHYNDLISHVFILF